MGQVKPPSSLTQGPRAGLGRVLVLGLDAVPEKNLHICLQLLCLPGFAHLRQGREMPQFCSLLKLSLLCLAGMAPWEPFLGTCTSPRWQERDSLELVPRVWPVEGLGRAYSSLGGHRAEPTKRSLEPLCRALLSWKSSVQSSPALQLWLQGQNITSPAAAAVGVPGHPWLWGMISAVGWEGKWVCREPLGVVCWDCAPCP